MNADHDWHVFICHASEDKEAVARPLANQLAALGLTVWLDESEIHIGDSLRAKIDAGLARSRFGVVILSSRFFAKKWPRTELDGLIAKENDGRKVILPIWHNITSEEIEQHSPILAGRVAVSTSEGLTAIAKKIVGAVNNAGPTYRRGTPIFSGKLTKRMLMGLPGGSFLLSNVYQPDFDALRRRNHSTRRISVPILGKIEPSGGRGAKVFSILGCICVSRLLVVTRFDYASIH